MKEFIKKIPLPIAGVMLGLAALGNLLQGYSETVRLLCGLMSALIGVCLLLKVTMFPGIFKEDMKNPIMASVSGTFSMALMLLSVYSKPCLGAASQYVWYLAILLHIMLIIYFTIYFIIKMDIHKVFASYYIVYVGIAVAGITAPAFEKQSIGAASFWFGFITLILLLILVSYRYIKYKEVPEPAQPLFCIYTAPASLCLGAYIQSVATKSQSLILFMACLATLIYILVLIRLPHLLRLKFYPSYAAFTFPFVISAIAMKMTQVCLTNMGIAVPCLTYVILIETIFATILVTYTFLRYIIFLLRK